MKLKHYIVGILLILIDQLIKVLVINKNFTIIPNFFNCTYAENHGAAFGLGSINIVTIVSIIIIVGIIIYIIHERDKKINSIPLVFILAGSIGNLIDRIFRGFVIDYIDINIFNFPIFNMADIFITIGIFLIILDLIKKKDDIIMKK